MQPKRIAINGFGRIGRLAFRNAYYKDNLEIVAINDLTENKTLAHLLEHDTAYRTFEEEVNYDGDHLIVGGQKIKALSKQNPGDLPWGELDIDIVLECTGVFRTKEKSQPHLDAGADKVIISAPAKDDETKEFVRGVNCQSYDGEKICDNASCTTNSTAPVMKVMNDNFDVKKAMLSTIHSYTSSQNLQDGPNSDLRRARAASENIVPTSTGAAKATTQVIPELEGKFDGVAFRVPTITVSLTDLTVVLGEETSEGEINEIFRQASEGSMKGIINTTREPLVSSDFIENPYSSTVDTKMTRVVDGNLVKIVAWYDNEWGYANRLVELAEIAADHE
jgi:glyceraldehyde 3-phosphate dehydrogenase